jgi:hypothetical protein
VSSKSASTRGRNLNHIQVCPAGKTVLGGGAEVVRNDGGELWYDIAITASYPSASDRWAAAAAQGTEVDFAWQLKVYAICADVN